MQYIVFILVVVSISIFANFESLYAQQLVQPNEKIDWQKEEQVCARYQASCRYAEQVLSNENWSSEKQAKWGAQLIWYTLKGIRMSGVRHTAYFHYATSHLNENQMSEEEKRNLDWEVEAFSRICDEISKMESQLMKLMESYDAKWKTNDKKAKQIWSLNKANCLLMATDEYQPSLVTDAWFDNISYGIIGTLSIPLCDVGRSVGAKFSANIVNNEVKSYASIFDWARRGGFIFLRSKSESRKMD